MLCFRDKRLIKKRFPMSGKLFKSDRFFKKIWLKPWEMNKKPDFLDKY